MSAPSPAVLAAIARHLVADQLREKVGHAVAKCVEMHADEDALHDLYEMDENDFTETLEGLARVEKCVAAGVLDADQALAALRALPRLPGFSVTIGGGP